MWPCFVCGADDLCSHREPELALWARRLAAAGRILPPAAPLPAPIPAAREIRSARGEQTELFELLRWAL